MSEPDTDMKLAKLESRVRKLEKALSAQNDIPSKQIVPVQKQMLSMSEAAEFLGLEMSGLRMLTHKKLIPYYKPNGKTCYFDPKELKQWQHRKRQKPVYEKEDTSAENNEMAEK